ncbi:hypothetical protein COCOR_01805 [Corallococcus coralloides DSM 2259]|uniref:Lipoprotein n=1 Tax=Corallococcus coralloides (strain ATCC 25202 / DSM 2259 / NBRC 100086 / M2) TaxID=1144275 RepID=H8N1J7_CORCM|nr:hypothetical protein [Corallococcus coralloides]AFE04300.1 hypothetical protein COCOR_01805 [Corallococcus coralloides DSM 2259]
MSAYRILASAAVWLSSAVALAAPPSSPRLPASAAAPGFTLDYARTLEQSGMVFVPYEEQNRGPLYYTQYTQVPTGTASVGDFRRIIVNLRPTAQVQGLYLPFVNQYGILDANISPIPAYGDCQPTQAVKDFLSFMPVGYRPALVASSHPVVCAVSLYFPSVYEQTVKDFIAAQPVLTLDATVPLCEPTSLRMDVNAINLALQTAGVLQVSGAGVWTGNQWDVIFESVRLTQTSPQLFATQDPQEGWRAYVQLFQLDPAAETATMSAANAQQRIFMCIPRPLHIRFGQVAEP